MTLKAARMGFEPRPTNVHEDGYYVVTAQLSPLGQ